MMTDQRPPCTCLGLPMGPGQSCDAHQLPKPPTHDDGPSIAECAEADAKHWAERHWTDSAEA